MLEIPPLRLYCASYLTLLTFVESCFSSFLDSQTIPKGRLGRLVPEFSNHFPRSVCDCDVM
jgi:hypothetical protein